MFRGILSYARPRPRDPTDRTQATLAHIAMGIAVATGTAQAMVIAGIWHAARSEDPHLPLVVAGLFSLTALVGWVIGLALSLAALADGDGPRRLAALAVAVLAVEVLGAVALLAFGTI